MRPITGTFSLHSFFPPSARVLVILQIQLQTPTSFRDAYDDKDDNERSTVMCSK